MRGAVLLRRTREQKNVLMVEGLALLVPYERNQAAVHFRYVSAVQELVREVSAEEPKQNLSRSRGGYGVELGVNRRRQGTWRRTTVKNRGRRA